jgi:SAM-dependent methyltransferase
MMEFASSRPSINGRALLNLGCGAEGGHPAFVNLDVNPGPGILQHDVRQGLPFPDASFDLVYHSTMLSMFRPGEALRLTEECQRVLKPGGVLRVVTEDLEQICRVYLEKLEAASRGDERSARDRDWMILELYDQATRERAGGDMLDYLSQDPLLNEAFVRARTGTQGNVIIAGAKAHARARSNHKSISRRGVLRRIAAAARQQIVTMLYGSRAVQALEIGNFRLTSGQVSYRMYDRYSLEQLFLRAGLSDVTVKTAHESACPFWHEVNLDLDASGAPARPHALTMEGKRSA